MVVATYIRPVNRFSSLGRKWHSGQFKNKDQSYDKKTKLWDSFLLQIFGSKKALTKKQKFAVKLQTVKLFKFTYSELAAGIYVCKGS